MVGSLTRELENRRKLGEGKMKWEMKMNLRGGGVRGMDREIWKDIGSTERRVWGMSSPKIPEKYQFIVCNIKAQKGPFTSP